MERRSYGGSCSVQQPIAGWIARRHRLGEGSVTFCSPHVARRPISVEVKAGDVAAGAHGRDEPPIGLPAFGQAGDYESQLLGGASIYLSSVVVDGEGSADQFAGHLGEMVWAFESDHDGSKSQRPSTDADPELGSTDADL